MYALEARHAGYVLAFAVGCLLSSVYGFWSGAWPFGVVEIIWAGVALRRYSSLRDAASRNRHNQRVCSGKQRQDRTQTQPLRIRR